MWSSPSQAVLGLTEKAWRTLMDEIARQTEEGMPNDTRHFTVKIGAKDLAEMLHGKTLEAIPQPNVGQRIVVDSISPPRYRSVQSEVSCEIDVRYHLEDVEPSTPPMDPKLNAELTATTMRAVLDPQPTGRKKS